MQPCYVSAEVLNELMRVESELAEAIAKKTGTNVTQVNIPPTDRVNFCNKETSAVRQSFLSTL